MRDNKENAIRLQSMVLRLSRDMDDLAENDSKNPKPMADGFRYNLALLDEYVSSYIISYLSLNKESSCLLRIRKELDVICSEGRFRRFIRSTKRRSYLVQLREDLTATMNAFLVSNTAIVHIKVNQVVRNII